MKKENNKLMRNYLMSISLYIIVFLTIILIIYLLIKGTHNEIIKKYNYDSLKEETIEYLNKERPHLVFILWGRDARNKKPLIDKSKHLVLESAHPSPLSAYNGFFGSKPFSKCNEFLINNGLKPIVW